MSWLWPATKREIVATCAPLRWLATFNCSGSLRVWPNYEEPVPSKAPKRDVWTFTLTMNYGSTMTNLAYYFNAHWSLNITLYMFLDSLYYLYILISIEVTLTSRGAQRILQGIQNTKKQKKNHFRHNNFLFLAYK